MLIPFQPPRWGTNPHFQTISAALLGKIPGYTPRQVGLLNESVVVPTQDDTGDRLFLHVHRFLGPENENSPVIVLIHGLEGSSDSLYIIKMADKFLKAGFHVVRMNLRTCGAGVYLANHPYNAGLTIDVETVLEFARSRISPYVAVIGFSLGANLVLKYMGEDRDERNRQRSVFRAPAIRGRIKDRIAGVFAAISPPLDLDASCEFLDSPSCNTYRNIFLKEIKDRVYAGKFDGIHHDISELKHIDNWFEFDHIYVAPSAGFRGAIEYYESAASRHYVHDIKTTGLVLHAYDDPLINPVGWDETNWEGLPWITAHLTERGGHLGWIAKKHPFFSDRRWMDYRVLNYLIEWRDSVRSTAKKRIFALK